MRDITTKQFQLLSDNQRVWDLLVENYADNGVMAPLCTVPEYRHKGLAAAALSAHYRRMKELGAVCMTGGGNEFYRRIGYNRKILTYGWKK